MLLARIPIMKIFTISVTKTAHTIKHPTKPSSSAIIEKMKSLSLMAKRVVLA